VAAAPRETGRVGGLQHSRLTDRRLTVSAAGALARANAGYFATVAPLVRLHLKRWELRARAVPDPLLRRLSLEKLSEEGFNAEVAATLATLAPRAHRAGAVRAIVALEVAYDYLDRLAEQAPAAHLREHRRLFGALVDAVTTDATLDARPDRHRNRSGADDGGYLEELIGAVGRAVAGLPAAAAIDEVVRGAMTRCAEAQARVHATTELGTAQLERWARAQAADTALQWREFLAGAAASVLAAHALIAAAADPRSTPAQATAIDTAYLSISALSTMLDSVIDYEYDANAGTPWYLRHYEDRERLARSLAEVARVAVRDARCLPNPAHHTMTVVGVVAYYTSASPARRAGARPVLARVRHELQPLIVPTSAVMRTWRQAKRLRRLRRATAQAIGEERG
jgi:tetraprenyl-beta-curcumene synthase